MSAQQIANSLDKGDRTIMLIMGAVKWLPTWSPRMSLLGLIATNGLLSELGQEVADIVIQEDVEPKQ